MAREVKTLLIDDIDGSEAVETITFSFDGADYVIDLNEKNAAKFRKAIHPFMEKARRERAVRGKQQKKPVNDRARNQEIREWAKGNGIEVNERGRIAASVIEKYDAAHA